ncbi:nicotinamide riboside transporter PnuC [Francisella adeliensis]|uniref:Nicotinamide riboside transporter PnuC n=1 Tax=Francisella adeliensis TaxID=2007306 RepID=A0A2Z4XVW1_9GAMM|nr:nicotinamide riboside transporter PnuC [Francisella adeliensis]AXA32984.1 nicotinamide mononucleotide transporter [Francisella adeliensis]MBK2086131.1 nicotinamide mononucleotide transporter [Francisella adeliensis]MBK2096705.1 nicotinamide mononucleotide transporter [Francisella adeliensis]QIW11210.1 nicotinamide mononucleotide transporter [Francisella adeliensis]QIW13086.1 nicotinamide mononucleotide transporter [Francisella adeliensis]
MNLLKSTISGWSKKEILWLCFCLTFTTLAGLATQSNALILIFSLLNIISLILAAKGKVLTYVFGFISAVMYAFISYKYNVFGQLILAVLFLAPVQIYGWYNWRKPENNTEKQEIRVKKLSIVQFAYLIIAMSLIAAVYGYFVLHLYFGQDIGLFADSIAEVVTIVAFILTVLLYRELWILWLIVDVLTITIWLDGVIDDAITIAIIPVAITKIVALINAIYGYIIWRKFYINKT